MRKVLLVLILSLTLASVASATTYYVSNRTSVDGGPFVSNASDGNSGTSPTSPWQTAGYACQRATAGDTVYFMGGTYDEVHSFAGYQGTMYPQNSGTASNWIVYLAHPDFSRPKIMGNEGVADRFGIYIRNVDYILVKGFEVTHAYRGIWIDNSDFITIDSCVSHHNGGARNDSNEGGVMIGYNDPYWAHNITVRNCSLYYNYHGYVTSGTDEMNTSGIHVYRCVNGLFENNVIYGQRNGNGIRLKWLDTACVVRNNTIYNCNLGIEVGTQGRYHEIYNNVIYNTYDHGIAVSDGIYDSADSVLIYNNTVYGAGGAGIVTYPTGTFEDIKIWNNILVDCKQSGTRYNLATTANNHPGMYSNHNLIWNSYSSSVVTWNNTNGLTLSSYQSASGLDGNSQGVNPQFQNASAGNFELSASSPEFLRSGGRGATEAGFASHIGARIDAPVQTQCPGSNQTSPTSGTLIAIIPPQTQTGIVPLRWSSVSGATSYQAQISSNSSFTDIEQAYTGTSPAWDAGGYGADKLADGPGTVHFWRVRAYTSDCGWSGWSSPWAFTLEDRAAPSGDF